MGILVLPLFVGSLGYIGYWCKIRVLIAWISFFSFNIWRTSWHKYGNDMYLPMFLESFKISIT
ncbi:hypothetical protein OUZ56_029710 [Daphnia magna]|uniref:Uncharacterized protein n=1 Tax=Daphnia magna TaxID=35525 RepID=A0ABR0B7K6_9CRUS|nr:hypothetical protein OUZ56_029710 [Daphnia magna]